jgi:hypothetical protein
MQSNHIRLTLRCIYTIDSKNYFFLVKEIISDKCPGVLANSGNGGRGKFVTTPQEIGAHSWNTPSKKHQED